MKFTDNQKVSNRVSFFQLFRLTFLIFSLYLLRNSFFRWDGFKFYATFSEFIPAVSLVSMLWTGTAFVITIFIWLFLRFSENTLDRMGLKVRAEHILAFAAINIALGLLIWKIKRLLWTETETSVLLKSAVLVSVLLLSAYLTWALRIRVIPWFQAIQVRITPLIWLFATFVLASLLLVGYHTFSTESFKPVPETFTQSVEPSSEEKPPNIILVVFDTLTSRDMSVYGYERPTTPFISKWAESASLFTRAEAENNHTTPTTASLMTGKRVWTHQVYHQSGSRPLKIESESLPEELKKKGYYNVAFIANPSASVKTLGIFDKFDISPLMTEFIEAENQEFFDFAWGDIATSLYKMFGDKIRLHNWILDARLLGRLEPLIMPRYKLMNPGYAQAAMPPEVAFNRFLEIYDELPQPFFAWIQIYPPHHPYLPPEQYRGMFGPKFPRERYKSFAEDIDSQDMHDMRILYDEFIRYCDRQFEEFMDRLENKNKYKNTAIIFTSDHGESFQHEIFQHAVPALYEQLTHVPLIIKEPGQTKRKVINDIVEQIDIPATILDLAQIPVPSWMEGRSLVPLMSGEDLSPRPAFSMYFEKNPSLGREITKGLVAVWEGDYKLIHYLEHNKSLLFNLREDPEEMTNIFDIEPEMGNHLLDLIKTNLNKVNDMNSSSYQPE